MVRIAHITLMFVMTFMACHVLADEDSLSKAEKNYVQGKLYYDNSQYEEAIREFSSAINHEPNNSNYHHWHAKACGELAEISGWPKALNLAEKSRESLKRAVGLDPENVSALTDLMRFYQQAPLFLGGSERKAKEISTQLEALKAKNGKSS